MNLILIFSFFFTPIIDEAFTKNDNKTYPEYQNPPKFALTEMNGRELEEKAYFTVKYDNTFELKLADGTIFKYVPYKHFGDEPLCNILARDKRGINTAICIKKLSGNKVKIMLENDEMISNFVGYKL